MSWDIYKPIIYDKWKKKWFDTHPYEIAEYSWNYLFTSGKEIRSKLFCELWIYLCPDLKVPAEIAFAIECIHVASLILDDSPWMDNANERRGRATLHIMFSPRKAILIANDILSMVFEIWKIHKPLHIDDNTWKTLLTSKLQRLATGQWLDLIKGGTLIELASLKTGVLFELVTETVALCTNIDSLFWKSWGNHLGILFQWVDDWIDRDEDIIQNNRNAFNESFDKTVSEYITIWKNLEKCIGSQWFNRPFGIFMKQYFIEQLGITIGINRIVKLDELFTFPKLWTIDDDKCKEYLYNVILSELKNKDIEKYTHLYHYIKHINYESLEKIFHTCNKLFEIPNTTLWMIDEDTWEQYIISKIKNIDILHIIKICKEYNYNLNIRERCMYISNKIFENPNISIDNLEEYILDLIKCF